MAAAIRYLSPGAIGGGALGAVTIFFLYQSFRKLRGVERKKNGDINKQIRMIRRVSTCKVISKTKMQYNYLFEIECISGDAYLYNYKYNWTGAGKLTHQEISDGIKLVDIPLASLPHNIIRVVFTNPLKENRKKTIEFMILAEGTDLHQRPYYAQDIKYFGKEPYEGRLVVDFSACAEVERAWIESYSSPTADWPSEDPMPVDISRNRVVELNLPKIDGRRHAICWSYKAT